MNVDDTFVWVEKLAVLTAALQTFEMFAIRDAWSERGIWRWSRLKADFPTTGNYLGLIFTEKNFARLLQLRIIVCAVLLVFPTNFPLFGWLLTYLLLSTYAISVRWRGTFNGGSDAMTIAVLTALTVGSFVPDMKYYCLAYVGIQMAFSFVLAGLSKLQSREWRSGRAIPALLTTSNFGVPKLQLRERMPAVSWFLIIFECTFPLAFFNPVFARLYFATAILFHIVNFFVFGLNRFFFAWISTYPVLFLFSSR